MYKFFLYSILIISYLGLAKTLSPSEHGVHYLQNEKGFSKIIKRNASTLILIDTHATGFLIKTYYQKYRLISGYDHIEEIIVRTSREFAKKNIPHIGLSIYRKDESVEEYLPLPPGSLYLNKEQYGEWKRRKDGKYYWKFYKVYKNFPQYLGWGKFRPTQDFFQDMRSSISLNKPFFGSNGEFGEKGSVTKINFPAFFSSERKKKVDMKTLLFEYFKENF